MYYYFNYPSLGLPDKISMQEMTAFAEKIRSNIIESSEDYTLKMVSLVEETREQIASMYGVSTKNIAFISNTTEGLGILASSLSKQNVSLDVVVPDIEFMSSALVWHGNSNSLNYIETRDGRVLTEKVKETLDGHANILCMSSVQEVSGFRFSFKELLHGRKKRKNEFWIIDGIQEAGVFRRDIEEEQIDAYIVGGHKWLNSPFGSGFMYINDRLLELIRPMFYGYLNLMEPENGWVNYLESRNRQLEDLYDIPRGNGARILESGGMINVVGALMLGKNLENWKKYGVKDAEQHVLGLQRLFKSKVNLDQDLKTLIEQEEYWSSIMLLTSKKGVSNEKKLIDQLSRRGIKTSLRSVKGIGGIRIGLHYSTTRREVEFLAESINDIQKKLGC
ncbi:hypothetical protein GCM10011409_39210 [Lentibacillus populi]|uniref:Aminotransferase class V domain-containing protein n=1 Tax=Lentibacillus populi TaxID=1827502 RepID=A0A9W5U120_9BACI|nr:aminotransferase class V-fold PLP-dependent enzyme [Lentibacillus populi]GGB57873.1 hypothetical protein GCM10011409_39210 [Lentibacillus populi]